MSHRFTKNTGEISFIAVEVHQSNIQFWQDLGKANMESRTHSNCANPDYSNAYTGAVGFCESLKYLGAQNLKMYVAYVINTRDVHKKIEFSYIEMFTTVSMAEGVPFSTHMGITRSDLYNGPKHSNLSLELHAFAAQLTLHLHPNILYMINNPAAPMRIILAEAYYKRGLLGTGMYITDHRAGLKQVSSTALEDLSDEMIKHHPIKMLAGKGGQYWLKAASDIIQKYIILQDKELNTKHKDYCPPLTFEFMEWLPLLHMHIKYKK